MGLEKDEPQRAQDNAHSRNSEAQRWAQRKLLWAQENFRCLSLTQSYALKARDRAFQLAAGGGLFVEVMPGGKRVWRLRYRPNGRQEKVTLGEYPSYSSGAARKWREECRERIGRGESPMAAKREAKESAPTAGRFAQHFVGSLGC